MVPSHRRALRAGLLSFRYIDGLNSGLGSPPDDWEPRETKSCRGDPGQPSRASGCWLMLRGSLVDGHEVAARALGQRVTVLQLVEGGAVVTVLQVRQLVNDQVVEDPLGQRGGTRGDPDRPRREGAAPPQVRHVGKRDRGPAESSAEIALVESARSLGQPLV